MVEYDPFSVDAMRDPFPTYRELRATAAALTTASVDRTVGAFRFEDITGAKNSFHVHALEKSPTELEVRLFDHSGEAVRALSGCRSTQSLSDYPGAICTLAISSASSLIHPVYVQAKDGDDRVSFQGRSSKFLYEAFGGDGRDRLSGTETANDHLDGQKGPDFIDLKGQRLAQIPDSLTVSDTPAQDLPCGDVAIGGDSADVEHADLARYFATKSSVVLQDLRADTSHAACLYGDTVSGQGLDPNAPQGDVLIGSPFQDQLREGQGQGVALPGFGPDYVDMGLDGGSVSGLRYLDRLVDGDISLQAGEEVADRFGSFGATASARRLRYGGRKTVVASQFTRLTTRGLKWVRVLSELQPLHRKPMTQVPGGVLSLIRAGFRYPSEIRLFEQAVRSRLIPAGASQVSMLTMDGKWIDLDVAFIGWQDAAAIFPADERAVTFGVRAPRRVLDPFNLVGVPDDELRAFVLAVKGGDPAQNQDPAALFVDVADVGPVLSTGLPDQLGATPLAKGIPLNRIFKIVDQDTRQWVKTNVPVLLLPILRWLVGNDQDTVVNSGPTVGGSEDRILDSAGGPSPLAIRPVLTAEQAP